MQRKEEYFKNQTNKTKIHANRRRRSTVFAEVVNASHCFIDSTRKK
jgi:hypothetical protein